ncbi:hypothetical protein ACG9XQ_05610 [Acinetobacter baumannii]|uniref:hypothetical protein n=1 Tax=Acinetobacter baumannii TaxID=470 RepID=UPI003AF9EB35
MKPEQFIREHGVEKAREVIAKDQFVADLCLITPSGKLIYYKKVKGSFPEVTDFGKVELTADDYSVLELSDLKRLVESLDLIKAYGGIESCKQSLYMLHELTEDPEPIREAVRDHESIYGGGDEAN